MEIPIRRLSHRVGRRTSRGLVGHRASRERTAESKGDREIMVSRLLQASSSAPEERWSDTKASQRA
jgi:hypothetical protein